MKLFRVYYEGSWMGGCALVFAKDATEAEELVAKDPGTFNFESVQVIEVETTGVVYNYNGDY